MRIRSVLIENFRSIERMECSFDSVTTLIGPNGAGKSTVLRALDWCLNAEKGAISETDIFAGAAPDSHVRVRIDFEALTALDRQALGPKYASDDSSEFTVWRTWTPHEEKLTGKALAYQPFEHIRAATGAVEKRTRYSALRDAEPQLQLPSCASAQAVDVALEAWERENPDALSEAEVSDTNLFGFNGKGKLAEIFDFIFVSADLRAGEEALDAKESILGKILQRALDRSQLQDGVNTLVEGFESEYHKLNQKHLSAQLGRLEAELSAQVSSLSRGRSIHLSPSLPNIKPQFPRIDLAVGSGSIRTPVQLQGHGFQRAMLLAALTVLSRHGHDNPTQMFLAIEEPELFQHPTQARAFASVLRELAQRETSRMQVAYATHSPYFIDSRFFDQIRRIASVKHGGDICSSATLTVATMEATAAALNDLVKLDTIRSRWDQVCLKYLPEALFAEKVILVEGDDDAAIIQGLEERGVDKLALQGVCVAPVSGKGNMMIPFTILRLLGIQTLMVVDNDSGCEARMRAKGQGEGKISEAVNKHKTDNRALCRLAGVLEEDFPREDVSPELYFIPDTLETVLASDLPSWETKRNDLVQDGRGVSGKNAATYELAARECEGPVGGVLGNVMEFIAAA